MTHPLAIAASFGLLASTFWFTADQQGQRAFQQEEYGDAADRFENPMWKGVALFRAGEFKEAQMMFARLDTAEAHYNRGNCLVFLGKYDEAVASYERALDRRPDWQQAEDNRVIAAARAERVKQEGGDMGDQMLGADEIVFDKTKPGGQETKLDEGGPIDDSSMQALWLRRVQTSPADFLKSKFAYQQQFGEEGAQ